MPLTYIIPIGPYGSGKTTLRKVFESGNYSFLEKFGLNKVDTFMFTCRDDLFHQVRVREKNGANKTRRILFDKKNKFFQKVELESNGEKHTVVYFDSTNSKLGSRCDLVKSVKPDNIVLINFKCFDVEVLLQRTMKRTSHPTFPREEEKQRENIEKVLPYIEYGCVEEFESFGVSSENVFLENIEF